MKNPVKLPVIYYGPFRAGKPTHCPLGTLKAGALFISIQMGFFLGCSKVNSTCEHIKKIVMGVH